MEKGFGMMSNTERKAYMEYIVYEYSDMLFNITYTYLKNKADAENAVQDLYVRMIHKNYGRDSFNDKNHEKAWLIRSVINICLNVLASAPRKRNVSMNEEITSDEDRHDYLHSEVMKLPEKYRIVIHMFYYEAYSIAEIAGYLEKKPATVGTWLKRGREMLKKKLGDDYLEN